MIVTMSKGFQISLPAHLRKKYGLKPGTRLHLQENGEELVLRPLTQPALDKVFEEVLQRTPHTLQPQELDTITKEKRQN